MASRGLFFGVSCPTHQKKGLQRILHCCSPFVDRFQLFFFLFAPFCENEPEPAAARGSEGCENPHKRGYP